VPVAFPPSCLRIKPPSLSFGRFRRKVKDAFRGREGLVGRKGDSFIVGVPCGGSAGGRTR
jgi:hypothetical protein